jgi:uncharacterized protein
MNQELVDAVSRWAVDDVRVTGVVLVGSHARGTARSDSDVDLVILAVQESELISDTSWVSRFGRVATKGLEHYGRVTSVRVTYAEGPEVEFAIADSGWASLPLDPGTRRVLAEGARVIYDEGGALRRALRSLGRSDAIASSGGQ